MKMLKRNYRLACSYAARADSDPATRKSNREIADYNLAAYHIVRDRWRARNLKQEKVKKAAKVKRATQRKRLQGAEWNF